MKLNKKVRKFAYASTVVVGALTPYLIFGGIVKAETPQDNPVETSEERTGNTGRKIFEDDAVRTI